MLLHLKHEERTIQVAQEFELEERVPVAAQVVSKKDDAGKAASATKKRKRLTIR